MVVEKKCEHDFEFKAEDHGHRLDWCHKCGALKYEARTSCCNQPEDEIALPDRMKDEM